MSGSRRAAWSVVLGFLAVLVLPVAIALTRYSGSYDLVHAGFAVPVAGLLGFAAISLARRSRTIGRGALRPDGARTARAGRLLGILGVCVASAGAIALAVFGLLLAVD